MNPALAAFQHGPSHLALRHSFLPLFGRKALGVYLSSQTAIIQKHLTAWLTAATRGPTEARDLVRALNQETSQSVFCGPYLDDQATFNKWYTDLTNGFLSAPIYLPGTNLWKAVEARKKVCGRGRGVTEALCVEREIAWDNAPICGTPWPRRSSLPSPLSASAQSRAWRPARPPHASSTSGRSASTRS